MSAHRVINVEGIIKILSLCYCAGDEDIASVDAASLKQAYAGLVTLILEAVKIDCDSSGVRYGLELFFCDVIMPATSDVNKCKQLNQHPYLVFLLYIIFSCFD